MSLIHTTAFSLLDNPGTSAELRQIHAHLIKSNVISHTASLSRLISSYSLSGELHLVAPLLHFPLKPFAFYSIIKHLSESKNPSKSISLYAQVLSFLSLDSLPGLEFLLPSVLKACGKSSAVEEGRQVHGQVLKSRFQDDPFVANSVLRMYSEFGEVEVAQKVFDEIPNRDVISWNSMISGCFKAGDVGLALKVFEGMPQKDLVSCNTMIAGSMKFGVCNFAFNLFERMHERDVVSWTTMISGYVLNGHPKEALELFRRMLRSGTRPDVVALVNVLSAVADLGFPDEGKWIHAYIQKRSNVELVSGNLGSALIDMYSKCGLVANAYDIFRSICHERRVGDWNSMITGLAMHGYGQEALEIFNKMERVEVEPDEITFLGLLNACSHSGLVEEGKNCFAVMCDKYKLKPKLQHYGCLIDLLSRAGRLEAAWRVIDEMPMRPDSTAWKSLLSACVKYGNVSIGKHVAMRAIELAPTDSSSYVLLSNLFARSEQWADVERVRALMNQRGIRKVPGCSSVMINGKIHVFLVGKVMGVVCQEIVLSKLEEVLNRLKLEGYEPDINEVLVDVDEEEKESLLSVHSEKMAIAFGLVSLEKGTAIHIVKNLRVCGDCHCFSKMVSKVYKCEIVLRDQNRFHHFKEGSCSCNDYW